MLLTDLLSDIKQADGIAQKTDIQVLSRALANSYTFGPHPNGDDTAVIETETGFDLFATEGFQTSFVKQDPWFAGWCGLMVNISDIAAMGGRPTAVVNALWGRQNEHCHKILQGMVDASNVFQVPIVGGHTNLHSDQTQLSVSILGRASHILSSFAAEPEHALIAAIDLRGSYRAPFLNWNAATNAPPQRLRGDLEILPRVAESGLAVAAKDISQAGILGTAVMLLESSGVGADIILKKIPKPNKVTWNDWLKSFPSFGYLLTCPKENIESLIHTFKERDIHAAHIGDIKQTPSLDVCYEDQQLNFWNLSAQALTGMTHKKQTILTNNFLQEQYYASQAF